MRVCFLGTYEKDYPRNQILLKAMQRGGMSVIECHVPVWEKGAHKTGEFKNIFKLCLRTARFLAAYLALIFRYLFVPAHDLVLIGYPGQLDMPALKWLVKLRRKPVVFDAFFSVYDAAISDRKLTVPDSLLGRLLFSLDQLSCRMAEHVLLDTNMHIRHFADTFGIESAKFSRIWAGADDSLFSPSLKKQEGDYCRVLFLGKFTPFHGIRVILDAAKILESERGIIFELAGTGQLYEDLRKKAAEFNLANVQFLGWVDYAKIPALFQNADICLGVFDDSDKGNRVIANKIFQALAAMKPVITARSEAVGELLEDMRSVYFTTPGDAAELAHAIITLKNDPKLADKLAVTGHRVFHENANLDCISRELTAIFKLAMKPCST